MDATEGSVLLNYYNQFLSHLAKGEIKEARELMRKAEDEVHDAAQFTPIRSLSNEGLTYRGEPYDPNVDAGLDTMIVGFCGKAVENPSKRDETMRDLSHALHMLEDTYYILGAHTDSLKTPQDFDRDTTLQTLLCQNQFISYGLNVILTTEDVLSNLPTEIDPISDMDGFRQMRKSLGVVGDMQIKRSRGSGYSDGYVGPGWAFHMRQ